MTAGIYFDFGLGFRSNLARWDRMDRIVLHPDMPVAEAAIVVAHNPIAAPCYIAAAVLDNLYYIATVVAAAAAAAGSPLDRIGQDTPGTVVASALALVRTRSHLPGRQAACRIHSRAGTAVQAEAGGSSQFRHLQIMSL